MQHQTFFCKSPFRIKSNFRNGEERVKPVVEIHTSLENYWCAFLSRAGYGSVDLLKNYDCVTFLNILDYELFRNDYEAEYVALNRKAK